MGNWVRKGWKLLVFLLNDLEFLTGQTLNELLGHEKIILLYHGTFLLNFIAISTLHRFTQFLEKLLISLQRK